MNHTRPDDGMSVSRSEAKKVNRQISTTVRNLKGKSRLADGSVAIPVVAHVLRGNKKKKRIKRANLNAQIQVLNNSYAGLTGPGASNTPFRFYLKKVKRTHNSRWFNLSATTRRGAESATARQMKKRLHKGGKSTLNIYFVKFAGISKRQGLLGYSTFPWRQQAHPKLDGLVVDYRTAFGNRAPYAEGDTATHEIGHWLGLLHPFEGGIDSCAGDPNTTGDFVADTPSEAVPTSGCPAANTSCPGSIGNVHNFMDYAVDSCMYMFTAGQAERMSGAWLTFRA